MRWAKSYSIVDHQLLHGKYLHRLSTEALALYLFFVVVGDREGQSFYAERSIIEILRLSPPAYSKSMKELVTNGLIDYRRPHVWVKNLEGNDDGKRRATNTHSVSEGRGKTQLQSNRGETRHTTKEVLETVLQQFQRQIR